MHIYRLLNDHKVDKYFPVMDTFTELHWFIYGNLFFSNMP